MKLIIIFGPPAVGKMTVGHELEKITGLKLFHNHMTIDIVTPFFEYGTPTAKKLINHFRDEIFKEVASSDLEGLIFTYVWDFNAKGDWEYIEKIAKIFKEKGGDVYYVELSANLEERIKRNKSEHRLLHKPSKRNTEDTEIKLIKHEDEYRMNSNPGEINEENYLRINNTDLSPSSVAENIKEYFNL